MNLSSISKIMNLFAKSQLCLRARHKVLATSYHGFYSPSFVASKPHVRCLKPKYYQCRILSTTIPRYQKENIEKQQTQDKIWTVPNVLSLARIAATPFLAYYIVNLEFYPATAILLGASVTDFVSMQLANYSRTIDGWIARSFKGQSSKLGSFLDPLADKLLVITLYGSMAYMHIIPDILMGLIVFRDVALLIAGVYIRYISIPAPRTMKKYFDHKHSAAQLSPTTLSKVNTAVQLITALFSLYGSANTDFPADVLIGLWYLAGFTTITSGISYIFAKNTYKITKR